MSDNCCDCFIEVRCYYPFKPCDCINYQNFWSLEMWEDSPEYQEYLNKENEHTNQTKAYYVRLVSLLRNQAEEVTADRCVAEYGPGGGNKTAKVSDALKSTAADAIEQLIKMLPKNSLSE